MSDVGSRDTKKSSDEGSARDISDDVARPSVEPKDESAGAATEETREPSLDDTAAQPLEEVPEEADAEATAKREELRRRYLLKRFWAAASGFWGRGGDRLAWPLSFSLLLLVFLTVGAQYGINLWNRGIFDALQTRDAETIFLLAMLFFPLAATSVGLGVINVYCRMTTQRRWRAWLSTHILDDWLKNGRYYQLNLVSGDHQNPEGRLTEDLRVSTDAPVDFAVGVTTASLSAITFIAVLWTIGGALTFTLSGVQSTLR